MGNKTTTETGKDFPRPLGKKEEKPEKGIDVSKWQGKINWEKVAKTGIRNVCVKMTEGATYVDPRFVENWNGAKEFGIKGVNCYHYFRGLSSSPERQVENIRKNLKCVDFNSEENVLAIDVEGRSNERVTPVQMADNLSKLLSLLEEDSIPVMIYTSSGYWNSSVEWDKYNFSVYPVWVTHWETQTPKLPQPWEQDGKTWSWWQYSSKGEVDGIAGHVDLDWVKA